MKEMCSWSAVQRRTWIGLNSSIPKADNGAALAGYAYYAAPHQARSELDCELGGLVAVVEDGVDLHDVEGGDDLRLVDELHDEVRLPVGEAAADGGTDAGGDVRIDDVEVEGDVDPVEVREVSYGAAHDARDPVGVYLLHGVHPDPRLPEHKPFLHVHRAEPDDHHVFRAHARALSADADEVGMAAAREHGERHAVNVPRGRGLRRVEVGVGVEPDDAGALERPRDARYGPDGDGVVAAEEDREEPLSDHG